MTDEGVVEDEQPLISILDENRPSGKLCDVTLVVEGESFRCHRFRLAQVSKYFAQMLFSNTSEEYRDDPIVLKEIQVSTFKEILQFTYTGLISISDSNLLNMIYASELYALTDIQDYCIQYIRLNLSTPKKKILKFFSLMKTKGIRNDALKYVVTEHVWQHFHYFSTIQAFFDLSFDELRIALLKSPLRVENQIALCAISRWLQRPGLSPEDRDAYSTELLKNCSFRDAHEEYIVKHYIKPTAVSITDGNFSNDVPHHIKPTAANDEYRTWLNVFIRCFHSSERGPVRNVFTSRKIISDLGWNFKCSLNPLWKILKAVHCNNLLYIMTQNINTNDQVFGLINSVTFTLEFILKPPPIVATGIELCRMDRCVYMYKKDFAEVVRNRVHEFPLHNDEELSRGVYAFNCEINSWTSLPPLRMLTSYGCLTCDDERGLVYLVGGYNNQRMIEGWAQAYDPRAKDWMLIPRSERAYIDAACCFQMGKLYASGGCVKEAVGRRDCETKMVEVYDPVAGSWRSIAPTNFSKRNHQLIPFEGQLWTFCNDVPVSNAIIEVYSHEHEKWSEDTSLAAAVRRYCSTSTAKPTLSTGESNIGVDVSKDIITYTVVSKTSNS